MSREGDEPLAAAAPLKLGSMIREEKAREKGRSAAQNPADSLEEKATQQGRSLR